MATTLIDTSDLAAILNTDWTDEQLDMVIDWEVRAIEAITGDLEDAARTFNTYVWPPTPYLYLPHKAASVQSVTMGTNTVNSDDYELQEAGAVIRRKGGFFEDYYYDGYYNRWAGDIAVEYTRTLETAVWRAALIDLARVAVNRSGVSFRRTGPHQFSAINSEAERQRILDRLRVAEPSGVLGFSTG